MVCRWLSNTCPLWRPWPGRGQPVPGASPLAQQGRYPWPRWEAPLLEPGESGSGGVHWTGTTPTPWAVTLVSLGPPTHKEGCVWPTFQPPTSGMGAGWLVPFLSAESSGSSLVDGTRLPGRRQLWVIAWGALQPSIREDPEGALSACPLQAQRTGGTDLLGMVPGALSPPVQQVGVEPGAEEQVWAERRA